MTAKDVMKRENMETATTTATRTELPIYKPTVDVVESTDSLTIHADMPGVNEDSVEIELEGHDLRIRGHYVPEMPEEFKSVYREYRSCNYERSFTLGDVIDRSGIKATVKDGVLSLQLPKVKEAQPKKIKVVKG